MKIHSYKDLVVWQKAMDLVSLIYKLTANFPNSELYGLSSQMRRAAISIPSNIAEGRRRGHKKEFLQFLFNAYGSGAELETQLEIAKRLPKMKSLDYTEIDLHLEEVMKMLNIMIKNLTG